MERKDTMPNKTNLLEETLQKSDGRKPYDIVAIKKASLSGKLIIVRIGNDKKPAIKEDIDEAYTLLSSALDKIKGLRVIVTHHAFTFERAQANCSLLIKTV